MVLNNFRHQGTQQISSLHKYRGLLTNEFRKPLQNNMLSRNDHHCRHDHQLRFCQSQYHLNRKILQKKKKNILRIQSTKVMFLEFLEIVIICYKIWQTLHCHAVYAAASFSKIFCYKPEKTLGRFWPLTQIKCEGHITNLKHAQTDFRFANLVQNKSTILILASFTKFHTSSLLRYGVILFTHIQTDGLPFFGC